MIHCLVVYLVSTCSQNLKFQYPVTQKKMSVEFQKYKEKKRKGVCAHGNVVLPYRTKHVCYLNIWFCIQALQADILGHNKDKRSTTRNVLQRRISPVMLVMISRMSNSIGGIMLLPYHEYNVIPLNNTNMILKQYYSCMIT